MRKAPAHPMRGPRRCGPRSGPRARWPSARRSWKTASRPRRRRRCRFVRWSRFLLSVVEPPLYYIGLRATLAARATLAELSFPATAAIIGVGVLGADLTATQWAGFIVVVAAVGALGWHERVSSEPVVEESRSAVPA